MLHKKISIYYLLLAALLGCAVSVFALKFFSTQPSTGEQVNTGTSSATNNCTYKLSRLAGYKYAHPLYMAEPECEWNGYIPLKSSITGFIDQMKTSGELDYASVYLKSLNTNDWMDIYPESQYHPGSLFKVVTMITLLKMAEYDPNILQQDVLYKKDPVAPPEQTFNSKRIEMGHSYKVKDLIQYMIVYSDNHATMLLHSIIDAGQMKRTFTDLGLKEPNIYGNSYTLTVKEYSEFISVLYDCGYLTIPSSEFAISMLLESDFNLGITKELPQNIKVAHKFGETGKPGNRELHESAVVYLDNNPYLLTIMTKGRESTKLAEMMSHISKMVYDSMVAKPM